MLLYYPCEEGNNMDSNFIKIETYNKEKNCTDFCYLDISELGLTDLIKLRKEILGKDHHLEAVLTSIINSEVGNEHEAYKTNRRKDQRTKQPLKMKKRTINKSRRRY